MTIAIVVQNDYPHIGEVRPWKIATSLNDAGHNVIFFAWNSRRGSVKEGLEYGKVYRFSYFLKSRFYPWLSAPSPLNLLWVLWITSVARKEKPDLFVASNIRIAIPTILAARLLGTPVVLDLQENNKEMASLRPKENLWHYLTRSSRLVGIFENLCMRLSDHVWIVVEERLQGVPPRIQRSVPISVIQHTPSFDDLPEIRPLPARAKPTFDIAYVGIFGKEIGSVDLILRALPDVIREDPNIRLLIAGASPGHRELETAIQGMGIGKHVVLAGIIPREDLAGWLRNGDLGVICYAVDRMTNTTVSNKLFHYMAAGLPVLSTAMAPTARIIEETQCGVVIPPEANHKDIAQIILRLKNSPEKCSAMAHNGIKAIREKYNWEVDFKEVQQTLSTLVKVNGTRGYSKAC